MKRTIFVFVLGLVVTALASAQLRAGGNMFVATRTLNLRASTGFFAANRGTLNYGDRVTVIQVSGRFAEVRSAANAALSGWTPSANLSPRQVISADTAGMTAREIALAGKGFNQEVEASFRRQAGGSLNYEDVDRVEAIRVDLEALRRFLEEGRLAMGE